MRTFVDFILEKMSFKQGKDNDYTASDRGTIFLTPEDKEEYKLRGKTHGNTSHAIKHYAEFDEAKFKEIGEKIRKHLKQLLQRSKINYIEYYNKDKGHSITEPEKALGAASYGELLNVLDVINDKQAEGKTLVRAERELLPFMKELTDLYAAEILEILGDAENLDKIKSKNIIISKLKTKEHISLTAKDRNGFLRYYLDLKSNIFVIADVSGSVRSCFEFSTSVDNWKGVINNFWRKKKSVSFTNPLVKEVFKEVIEGKIK